MAKFQRKKKESSPGIPTASLPDIIFMLIFFFMVSASIKEVSLMVENTLPQATEHKKLENKSAITYIYVGKPRTKYQKTHGTEDRIQLNDAFKEVNDIGQHIAAVQENMSDEDKNKMMVSMKVDEEVEMGIITDTKQQLRRAGALKINYATRQMRNQ